MSRFYYFVNIKYESVPSIKMDEEGANYLKSICKKAKNARRRAEYSGDGSFRLSSSDSDDPSASESENIDRHVNELVYYIVIRAGQQSIFKMQELKSILTDVPKGQLYFKMVVDKVTKVLQKVYGYNMIVAPSEMQTQSKCYIITNRLPYVENPSEEQDTDKDPNNILLLLVLAHIFMSLNRTTEDSLHTFLESLNIHVEGNHEVFGNVKDQINSFKLKKYINVEVEEGSQEHIFSWGAVAETTISKRDILNFVCKIYGNRQPSSWPEHCKEADKQNFLNERETSS